jgi:NIPSNAP
MIYELRTYTLNNGTLPAYIQHVEKVGRPVRGDDYGKCWGYWTSEFGMLNQAWHLWSYASLDERTRMREALSGNERWTREYTPVVQPMLQRQDIRFLNPVVDLKVPDPGGVYELRMYRTQPGKAAQWAQMFKAIMPVREKYSKNVCIWTGEAPQPNEVVHMWNYPDLNTRAKVRAEAFQDPQWKAFVAEGGPLLLEMQSVVLMPTPFSALR